MGQNVKLTASDKFQLGAYRADLMALQRWLAQRDTSLMYATRADLLAIIANRAKEGVAAVVLKVVVAPDFI